MFYFDINIESGRRQNIVIPINVVYSKYIGQLGHLNNMCFAKNSHLYIIWPNVYTFYLSCDLCHSIKLYDTKIRPSSNSKNCFEDKDIHTCYPPRALQSKLEDQDNINVSTRRFD